MKHVIVLQFYAMTVAYYIMDAFISEECNRKVESTHGQQRQGTQKCCLYVYNLGFHLSQTNDINVHCTSQTGLYTVLLISNVIMD